MLNQLQKSHLQPCAHCFGYKIFSSVPNIIADNSLQGTVAFINSDFDAHIVQLHVESFNFLPAYTAAPPAVVTASVKLINLIPESESLSAGMHILWMEKFGKSTNFDSC